jgi:hypothetical protein
VWRAENVLNSFVWEHRNALVRVRSLDGDGQAPFRFEICVRHGRRRGEVRGWLEQQGNRGKIGELFQSVRERDPGFLTYRDQVISGLEAELGLLAAA